MLLATQQATAECVLFEASLSLVLADVKVCCVSHVFLLAHLHLCDAGTGGRVLNAGTRSSGRAMSILEYLMALWSI